MEEFNLLGGFHGLKVLETQGTVIPDQLLLRFPKSTLFDDPLAAFALAGAIQGDDILVGALVPLLALDHAHHIPPVVFTYIFGLFHSVCALQF